MSIRIKSQLLAQTHGQYYILVDGLEEAKKQATWGTYGKNGLTHCRGTCPEHQLRYVRLIDCSTEHLLAIVNSQYQIKGGDYEEIILSILKDRDVKLEKNEYGLLHQSIK
jgi:hypothetical protein